MAILRVATAVLSAGLLGADALVQPNAAKVRAASKEVAPGLVELQLCDGKGSFCTSRSHVLATATWSSHCDSLEDVGPLAVKNFSALSTNSMIRVSLFSTAVCMGQPVDANGHSFGSYSVTKMSSWYTLSEETAVRSVLITVAGYPDPMDPAEIGVKLVLWPLEDQQTACDGNRSSIAGTIALKNGEVKCVPPLTRNACLLRNPVPGSVADYGFLDSLDDLDFDWEIAQTLDGSTGDGYPMGSYYMHRYTAAWQGHAACRGDQLTSLPMGRCLVTKLYGQQCNEIVKGFGLKAWTVRQELYTLHMGTPGNVGFTATTSSAEPAQARIHCAWTRLLPC